MTVCVTAVRGAETARSLGEKGGENTERVKQIEDSRCWLKSGGWALEEETECFFRRREIGECFLA